MEHLIPPQAVVMQMVMGAWISRTISAICELHIPDLLKKHGPCTALQLTNDHGVRANPLFLQRALRAAASVGLLSEDSSGRFGPTRLSEVLTSDAPDSLKAIVEMFGRSWWQVWGGLTDCIKQGHDQSQAELGMGYWDYMDANPDEMQRFGEAMKANSASSIRGVLAHCDLSEHRTVADVGGGFGHLAIALLKKHPDLRAILLDVPRLIPLVKERLSKEDPSVASRLQLEGGDMFEAVPPADVYVLKHIIHDWDDDRCTKLLANCAKQLPAGGKVICVDAVLPPLGDTSGVPAKFLDINMMVMIPGKERTQAEWEALYSAAGLRVTRIVPLTDNFGTSVIEGTR